MRWKHKQRTEVVLYSIDERRPSIEHTRPEHSSSIVARVPPLLRDEKERRGLRSRLGLALAIQ